MRISDWSSDVCSSDLPEQGFQELHATLPGGSRLSPTKSPARPEGLSRPLTLPLFRRLSHDPAPRTARGWRSRSEAHTSELQSLMRISYAVLCLKKKKTSHTNNNSLQHTT